MEYDLTIINDYESISLISKNSKDDELLEHLREDGKQYILRPIAFCYKNNKINRIIFKKTSISNLEKEMKSLSKTL